MSADAREPLPQVLPPPDDVGVAAWATLLRAHATVVAVIAQDVQARTGLALSRYDVLLELAAAPDRQLRMQQLSDRVVLSRTRVSRLVDEMAGDGLVERRPDPDDGRATHAHLTDAGHAALRRAAPTYLSSIQTHFSRHLTDRQLVTLRTGLEQLLDAYNPADCPAGPGHDLHRSP